MFPLPLKIIAGFTVCCPSVLMQSWSVACLLSRPDPGCEIQIWLLPAIHRSYLDLHKRQWHLIYIQSILGRPSTICIIHNWSFMSPSFGLHNLPKVSMKLLNSFPAIIGSIFLFVRSPSQWNVVSAFELLKSIVTGFKLTSLYFSITALYFLFHLCSKPKLGNFASFCLSQLEFGNEEFRGQGVFLTISSSLTNHLSPASCFSGTTSICFLFIFGNFWQMEFLALFHFTTKDLLTCLASATFCHLFLELERLSKMSSVCFLNSFV